MAPHPDLLAGLAAHLGQALAFADDTAERQRVTIDSPSTRSALNANARSFVIGALRRRPIAGHQLLERHTDLNKVVVQDAASKIRYWLKSETAVKFTFERPADRLFTIPSDSEVLTFAIDGNEVEFRHAPITRLRNKKYKLETDLRFAGRFPLGGLIPPGGSPSAWAIGTFDSGPDDSFDDVFGDEQDGDEEQGGEESA